MVLVDGIDGEDGIFPNERMAVFLEAVLSRRRSRDISCAQHMTGLSERGVRAARILGPFVGNGELLLVCTRWDVAAVVRYLTHLRQGLLTKSFRMALLFCVSHSTLKTRIYIPNQDHLLLQLPGVIQLRTDPKCH